MERSVFGVDFLSWLRTVDGKGGIESVSGLFVYRIRNVDLRGLRSELMKGALGDLYLKNFGLFCKQDRQCLINIYLST